MKTFVCSIEQINWDKRPATLNIKGFAYCEGVDISTNEKVKKSIKISNGKKTYVISAPNELRPDITEEYGKDEYNYDYAGFNCKIDVGFLDCMHPLDEGDWTIKLYINADGNENIIDLKYDGVFNDIKPKNINYVKTNTVYKILVDVSWKGDVVIQSSEKQVRFLKLKVKKDKFMKKTKFGKFINKKKKKLAENSITSLYSLFSMLPIKENKVAFLTDSRGGLIGNFRFVYEELERRGGFDIKSICKPHDNMKKTFMEKIRIVYYMATCKAVFLDDYYPFIYNIKPREGVQLVQLWHAPGAFKTFGFSREGKLGWTSNKRAKNHRAYTHAIVSSQNISKHYSEAYGIDESKVYATGVPRTDVFFDEKYKEEKITELYEKYPILKDKKVILFAPTFRGKGRGGYYNFELLDLDKLKAELSDEYVLAIKLHPFISNCPQWDDKYSDFMIDLSHEKEINDLLFISDILVTDYSSVTFEFALLNKPIIFFAYDLEDYIAKRDFYYPYESFVPGPIVRNSNELTNIIKNKDFGMDKLEKFRNKFFDHFDGKSTDRVIDMLF